MKTRPLPHVRHGSPEPGSRSSRLRVHHQDDLPEEGTLQSRWLPVRARAVRSLASLLTACSMKTGNVVGPEHCWDKAPLLQAHCSALQCSLMVDRFYPSSWLGARQGFQAFGQTLGSDRCRRNRCIRPSIIAGLFDVVYTQHPF